MLSGTNDNDRKLFKVSCEGSCKGVDILLDYSMSDGDPDLCARYFFFNKNSLRIILIKKLQNIRELHQGNIAVGRFFVDISRPSIHQ